VGLEGDEPPSGGPVDGDEKVATLGFVGHLGQVLDIDVEKAPAHRP
jgi:hypothetical protein